MERGVGELGSKVGGWGWRVESGLESGELGSWGGGVGGVGVGGWNRVVGVGGCSWFETVKVP